MQFKSSITKIGCAVLGSSSLTAVFIGLGGNSASAQIIIQSTGTLSGTLELPSFNPNFNKDITEIDTDSQGVYQRNIGSKSKPNYVPVYKSDYVKVKTNTDGSLRYFVEFKGIPVISLNGVLTSPVLSGGQLTPFTYQGKIANTSFQGVVQDEFGLTKAFYTGVVTDPKTGKQYEGTFQLNGQGPRYSDRNGGESPTVFDYKSDIPGKPTVTTYEMKNSPLVRLTITVPENATVINSNSNNTAIPTTPVVNNPPTSAPVPSTPIAASVDSMAIATAPTTPVVSNTPSSTSVVNTPAIATAPGQPNISSTLETESNVEFSSGYALTANPVSVDQICTRDSANCRPKVKQAIGPRSRILVR